MRFGSYNIEIPFNELKGHRRILMQFPAGLKIHAREIADCVEKETGSEIFISSDSCFGACDLAIDLARSVSADLLIHFGHLPIPNLEIDFPVKFVNATLDIDIGGVTDMIIKSVKEKRISLVTTAQHIDYICGIKERLEEAGYHVSIGEGDRRIARPGLVLGCNFSSVPDDVDAIVFIGTGSFHPTGIALSTKKPVYSLNPVSMSIKNPDDLSLEINKLIGRRLSLIELSKDAETFGILISKKPGQNRCSVALNIQRKLKEKGKGASILVFDEIKPEVLKNFGKFDCLISTACPRLAMDDFLLFDTPILTPVEFEILIGEREEKDYMFDQISAGSGI